MDKENVYAVLDIGETNTKLVLGTIFSEKLNARIPLDLIAFDEEKDIAILRIQSTDVIKNQPFLSIESKDSHIADRVFTMGYPDPQRQGINIKYTAGDINSNTGLIDAPWMYQVSVPIQKGNSGGPLINENGAVIGLIFATLKNDMYSTTQNVNYAVKVKYLMELAKRNNCDIFFQDLRKRTKSEIIKKCESAIYLIEAK
jgi:S1-C subfamily serine protease